MVDSGCVEGSINNACKWNESHDANRKYLGAGMLYYAMVYTLQAQRCVCLGSGGGFVPRVMVEAQRDLVSIGRLDHVDVTLIDAGDGGTSGEVPGWQDFFFESYPEVKLIRSLTDDAVDSVGEINYLHVDADHHYEQALKDLRNYSAKMAGNWAITAHDTYTTSPGFVQAWAAVQAFAEEAGHAVVNFKVGTGVALIRPKGGR